MRSANVLRTRPRELGRTIWLKEFNVQIIIFYWNVFCNTTVPFIKKTSIKRSRHDVLHRQNIFLLDNQFFESTSWHTVHNNVFSTWNKLMILASSLEGAAIWKPAFKKWNVFLNIFGAYKLCCGTSNFTLCKFKQLTGARICYEVSSS